MQTFPSLMRSLIAPATSSMGTVGRLDAGGGHAISGLGRFSEASTTDLMCLDLAVRASGLEVETKLGCDDDFVAERRERFSDKLFVCIGTAASAVSKNVTPLS